MAVVLYICSVFALAFITIATANDECTYTKDTQTGCTVDRGHAVCEPRDVDASVRGIPACTTWITLSLQNIDSYINLIWAPIFASLHNSLPQLERLSITVQQDKYNKIRKTYFADMYMPTYFPKLKILQINVASKFINPTRTTLLHQSLQVLDLTRSRAGIADATRFCKTLPAVKKLILRNIQSIRHFRHYVPSVNLTDFVCIGNVHYLDLSYNDLVAINLGSMCWGIKLEVLILDHNMFGSVSSIHTGISHYLAILETAQQLKTLNVNYCSSTTPYHKGLWDDNDVRTNITGLKNDGNIDHLLSALNDVIPHTPLSLFAGYGYWIQDMMKHCGNIHYRQVAKCINIDKVCAFFSCVAPDFNMTACHDDHRPFETFSRQFCDYSECLYNMKLPLPRSLTEISMRELGKFSYHPANPIRTPNESVLCFHPDNNIEIIDVANSILNLNLGKNVVYGLKKLKCISIQGCHIMYVVNPLILSDMESLEEVHIGGNRLFENDHLPAVVFQHNIKLAVLNLSYSNLQTIESNAFINNKHLAVLDLSHNHLDASSLAALDLSNNNITHLNLSFNALTTLPAEVRYHFDRFNDLVLDLSGNNFLCNCQHLDFLQWIQSNAAITFVYAGDHVCSDSPGYTIHNIEVGTLYCNWYWEQSAIAVGCSLLLFMFFLTIFIIYRKRWLIRNLIFWLQENFSRNPEDVTDATSYKYDAFVLYSSIKADRLWVHYKLVPELETVYGFRLCIHHRDFPAGFDIVDNIQAAIRSSRKVLVIMSENFVNSDWCVEEVQMTRSVDRSKLIVIMYSDVSAVRTPTVIQQLLETRTYIEWAEDAQAQVLFWKKLRKALYTKTGQQEPPANFEIDSLAINLLPTGDILT